MFDNVYPESYPHIWHLAVDTGWDKRDIVAFVNLDKEKSIKLDLQDIGLNKNGDYHCFEFFEKKYRGQSSSLFKMTTKVPTARLMVIVPKRNYPWVLSTTFHHSQGAVELDQVKWDEKRQTLSGVLNRPSGARGSIFITVPHGLGCSLRERRQKLWNWKSFQKIM